MSSGLWFTDFCIIPQYIKDKMNESLLQELWISETIRIRVMMMMTILGKSVLSLVSHLLNQSHHLVTYGAIQ